MENILVIFASATTVARIKKGLSAKHFKAVIRQTPQFIAINGCSYAVETEKQAITYIKELADKIGVKIKAIYETDGKNYRLLETGR